VPSRFTHSAYPLTYWPLNAMEERLVAGGALEGTCPVCGERAAFLRFNANLRESGCCSVCGANNRKRQVAFILRQFCGLPHSGPLAFRSDYVIYNTETSGAFHQQLAQHASYFSSEYFGPQFQPGSLVNGVRHEDLQNLSFENNSIELVLSSDVLEHMPDPYRAHAEIHRALMVGGRHIFTVPFDSGAYQDQVRASMVEGEIVHHMPAIYHGDPLNPNEGILVYRIFALEMLVRLNQIGFNTRMWVLHEPDFGIVGPGALVFEAVKLAPGSSMAQ
jgi:SAM-dependent methyltransferase